MHRVFVDASPPKESAKGLFFVRQADPFQRMMTAMPTTACIPITASRPTGLLRCGWSSA